MEKNGFERGNCIGNVERGGGMKFVNLKNLKNRDVSALTGTKLPWKMLFEIHVWLEILLFPWGGRGEERGGEGGRKGNDFINHCSWIPVFIVH